PPRSPLFPYTTLFRSRGDRAPGPPGLSAGRDRILVPLGRPAPLQDRPFLPDGSDRRRRLPARPRARSGRVVLARGRSPADFLSRSEEHTSELQSLAYL